ncbi:DMT family transporter [Clostridium sp. KNHs216]|uniref:DMT family transporter n=1 Tax=Clostridium sp. KNHs216 TaxID=1550235 RepID=UPI0005A6237D|nr:DMT family transporter [Clostridium sp. KNHs216]TQI65650.1 threonine/homoserine efflux transporter RhtA [Clostridium sp. KNHs216]
MASSSSQRRSVGLMAVCAGLWSIAGIFIKLVPWNAMVIAGFRSLIAAVVVLVFMRMTGRRVKLNLSSFQSGVCIAATFFAFVSANKMTTAANAIVLQFTSPVFILIISALVFHQHFHRMDLITVVVTLFGISLFFFDKLGAGKLIGNCLAILAGLFMAGMYVITGRTDDDSRMSGILFGHLLTAVIGVPMIFIFPTPVSSTAVISILALGVIQLGIPYILYGLAVKDCPPLACSLVGAIEPLLNPLWVFLFDGERPGKFALLGGAIVIAAVTGWCVWRDRFVSVNSQNSLND